MQKVVLKNNEYLEDGNEDGVHLKISQKLLDLKNLTKYY